MDFKLIWAILRIKTILWFTVSTCLGFSAFIVGSAPDGNIVFIILGIACVNIGAILINDIGDVAVDRLSSEEGKRNRPITSEKISIKTGWILTSLFIGLGLIFSYFHSLSASLFIGVIVIFSIIYSLPPFRLCGKPYWSILYWILLMLTCYFLMTYTLTGNLNFNPPSFIFLIGIILFMGIAEIIAKDLRDFENDFEGGRRTFVYTLGIPKSVVVMIATAWIGTSLWILAFYIAERGGNLFAIICSITGIIWTIYITTSGLKLRRVFLQKEAKQLHGNWTYVYALMQLLTFLSFTWN